VLLTSHQRNKDIQYSLYHFFVVEVLKKNIVCSKEVTQTAHSFQESTEEEYCSRKVTQTAVESTYLTSQLRNTGQLKKEGLIRFVPL
jgi:hypothetical protein